MGEVPSDPVEILGMKFLNRVGLAAGMDKEADTVGMILSGTIPCHEQEGMPLILPSVRYCRYGIYS